MKPVCVKCGADLDDSAMGRPKNYCGQACKRSAEHEIRRLNALLGKLEQSASHSRLGYGHDPVDRLKKIEAEIALQERRLKVLLEDSQG